MTSNETIYTPSPHELRFTDVMLRTRREPEPPPTPRPVIPMETLLADWRTLRDAHRADAARQVEIRQDRTRVHEAVQAAKEALEGLRKAAADVVGTEGEAEAMAAVEAKRGELSRLQDRERILTMSVEGFRRAKDRQFDLVAGARARVINEINRQELAKVLPLVLVPLVQAYSASHDHVNGWAAWLAEVLPAPEPAQLLEVRTALLQAYGVEV